MGKPNCDCLLTRARDFARSSERLARGRLHGDQGHDVAAFVPLPNINTTRVALRVAFEHMN